MRTRGLESSALPKAAADRLPFNELGKLLELERAGQQKPPAKKVDRLRLRLATMETLWRDNGRPDAASMMLKDLETMPDGRLLAVTRRLRDDLFHYLIEIDRQRRSFDPALTAWHDLLLRSGNFPASRPGTTDKMEDVGTQVGRMCELLAECVDLPLYVLKALDGLPHDLPPAAAGRMPGYHLDRPPSAGRASGRDYLAGTYLLPVCFEQRAECAAAGHAAALEAKKALAKAERGEERRKISDDLYVIDASFITLGNDLRSKRRAGRRSAQANADPAAL